MKNEVDVAIIGNGVAANCIAIALAEAGIETVVLGMPPKSQSLFEHLQPGVIAAAASIGVDFSSLEGCWAAPGNLSLWGTAEPIAASYLGDPEGVGHNLDRDAFDNSLRIAAVQAGSRHEDRFRLVDARRDDGRTILTGIVKKDVMCVAAKLVVDASGRSAALGRRLGARRISHDRLLALAVVGLATPECDARLIVEAAPNGWWYAVRLAGDRAMAVYLTDADLLPIGRAERRSHWQEELGRTRLVAQRIHQGAGLTSLHQADSRTLWLAPQGAPGWIAVGDAAMAFDPISGSGVVKAMNDAQETAEAITGQFTGDNEHMTRLIERRKSRFEAYLAELARIYHSARLSARGEFWARRLRPIQP